MREIRSSTGIIVVVIAAVIGSLFFWLSSNKNARESDSLIFDIWRPAKQKNIVVSTPKPNSLITNPLLIKGMAQVFEGTVLFRLRDENKNILSKGYTTAESGVEMSNFEGKLSFKKPANTKGILEVFWQSPLDGLEKDLVSIPVKFQ